MKALRKTEDADRTCILSRVAYPREEMIRFVLSPDLEVVPDIKGNLPGRGAWLYASRASVEGAISKKAFARAFKQAVQVGQNLPAMIDNILEQQALQALSFTNKAGALVCGWHQVEAQIMKGELEALLHANDASVEGGRKARQLCLRVFGEEDAPPILSLFKSAQLDRVLGREGIVHVALLPNAVTENFLSKYTRLERYRELES